MNFAPLWSDDSQLFEMLLLLQQWQKGKTCQLRSSIDLILLCFFSLKKEEEEERKMGQGAHKYILDHLALIWSVSADKNQ